MEEPSENEYTTYLKRPKKRESLNNNSTEKSMKYGDFSSNFEPKMGASISQYDGNSVVTKIS